jgi:hypothetical protein
LDTQLVIKVLLIVVFAAFAVFLMLPGRGVRHVAIRRIVMLALLVVVVFAVVFPSSLSTIASLVGVGRGTDLLLYGLIVVFIGNSLIEHRRARQLERQITVLARRIALDESPEPSRPRATEADGAEPTER